MGWGLMIGAGEGIQQAGQIVGNHYAQKSKQEFEEKLQEKREARAEERQIRAENREQIRLETTPDPERKTFRTDESGETWEVTRSATDKVLEEKLASKEDIEAKRHQEEKDKLDRETKLADIRYKDALVANAGLEGRFKQARYENYGAEVGSRIEANEARAEASRAQAAKAYRSPTSVTTARDLGDALVEQSPGLEAKYTEGDNPKMSKAELADVAMKTYDTVYTKKGRPATERDLRIALEDYVNVQRNKGKPSAPKKTTFKVK